MLVLDLKPVNWAELVANDMVADQVNYVLDAQIYIYFGTGFDVSETLRHWYRNGLIPKCFDTEVSGNLCYFVLFRHYSHRYQSIK